MITSRRGGCWHFLRVFNSWLIPTIFSPFFTLILSFSLQQGDLWVPAGAGCSGGAVAGTWWPLLRAQ